ncbi:Spx/MgsR family RNA polymerase-binding regulatory protein [Echinicola vietnamensis]|uniref:Transcriptional regulator, Spx/MgsR family n=1 Tax=Echinicola vietnamensis (strain DSM 17526 / LMG 23754 / KMM 6221) TaxID=926556 RepID=L0FUT9_ECHVK|nr:Spx/MgsR family RNA polymerase-binding regulatory protein [Echinicola vietnamensis]AGA76445.1 transcriptional regulator, Spx/MgsR family [Echinicola vietnamensis DSM 17526]
MEKKLTVYGIKNCDTMKKTFKFLEENEVAYEFVDYKKTPPTPSLLEAFLEEVPLDKLVNKRGTTYRKLTDDEKAKMDAESTAVPILVANSSMIKRPVMVYPDGTVLLGFQKEAILDKK